MAKPCDDLHRPEAGADRVEPVSGQDLAQLVADGVLDMVAHDPAVPVTAWRVIAPERSSAFGVPLVDGLTPRLAAVLITLYSRTGGLIVDLTSHLAVEGVTRAGGRRYVKAHPAVASILAAARRRDDWPPADLVLLRWPRHDAAQSILAPELPTLLHDCRMLLDPNGHLVVVLGLGRIEMRAEHALVVISIAHQERLRLTHHHIAFTQPHLQGPVPARVDLLVLTSGGRHER